MSQTITGNLINGVYVVSGTLSAATNSAPFRLEKGTAVFVIGGVFVASVRIERQPPGTSLWVPVAGDTFGTAPLYSAPTTLLLDEFQGADYRVVVSSYTSGSVEYRFSQTSVQGAFE